MPPIKRNVFFYVLLYFFLAYVFGLILRSFSPVSILLSKLSPPFLLLANIISLILGLPFSLFFDFSLFYLYGLQYLIFWPCLVSLISTFQVFLFRAVGEGRFFKGIWLKDNLMLRGKISKIPWINAQHVNSSLVILFVRSVPILPFAVASLFIAGLPNRLGGVFCLSFIGSLVYYIFIFWGFKLGFQ